MGAGSFNAGHPIMFESVSNVTATPSVQLGTRTIVNGEDYCYIYNAAADTATKDHGVIITAMTGYSISLQSVTMVGGFFGLVKHADIPAASYGWVLTKGFGQGLAGTTKSLATGDPLVCGVSGTFGRNTGAATAYCNGFVINGAATAATADVFFVGM